MTTDQRAFGAAIVISGYLMAALALLPWFDFGTFSISGIDLPSVAGEVYLLIGVLIAGIGGILFRREWGITFGCVALLGTIGFALCAEQVLTDWQAGSCGWFGTASGPHFICRSDSDIMWNVRGSPSPVLWAATGLSAFVTLLSGWWLLGRPAAHVAGSSRSTEAWA